MSLLELHIAVEIGLPTYLLGLKGRAVPKATLDTTVPVSLLLVFLVGWTALFALAVRMATVRHFCGVVCRAFRVLGLQRIVLPFLSAVS